MKLKKLPVETIVRIEFDKIRAALMTGASVAYEMSAADAKKIQLNAYHRNEKLQIRAVKDGGVTVGYEITKLAAPIKRRPGTALSAVGKLLVPAVEVAAKKPATKVVAEKKPTGKTVTAKKPATKAVAEKKPTGKTVTAKKPATKAVAEKAPAKKAAAKKGG